LLPPQKRGGRAGGLAHDRDQERADRTRQDLARLRGRSPRRSISTLWFGGRKGYPTRWPNRWKQMRSAFAADYTSDRW